ncbi:MAG: nitronate monooxygenase, partial [Vicinamibacterales bacterium]
FPVPEYADHVWHRYFVPGGKTGREAFLAIDMPGAEPSDEWQALVVVANFVEVFLAREGHGHPVGINYLEKIQTPHLPSLYGAMLAGVEYVLMGAGIPMRIPGVLDRLARHEPATYPLAVTGAGPDEPATLTFDPQAFLGRALPPLTRPKFLAIIASDVLAQTLVRKANGRVDGFIVEGPTAGGHNAPPRGARQLNARGEPIYGPRDIVNLEKLKGLGLPFWLAGGAGSPEGLRAAIAQGAEGVQLGTAFAMCADSGLRGDLRRALLKRVADGTAEVTTNAAASPTGFPFKVASLDGTLSDPAVGAARPRVCDLGYLREAYRTDEGGVAFRCPAEPVNVFVAKSGHADQTDGRSCICNALMATAGLPQVRAGKWVEPPIVTMGDDLAGVGRFLPPGAADYTAADVVTRLMAGIEPRPGTDC